MPREKNRVLRVPDELWDAAKAKALKEGTTVSAVIRRLLTAWLKALVVLAAVVGLSACGADEPATSPAGERTAPAATQGAETPEATVSEPVSTRPTIKPLGEKFAVGHAGTISVRQLEPRTYVVEVYTGELVEFAGTYIGTDSAGVEHHGVLLTAPFRAHGYGGNRVSFDTDDIVTITYTDTDLDVAFTWTIA